MNIDGYIVVSNSFSQDTLGKCSQYRGIDRNAWPLYALDWKEVKKTSDGNEIDISVEELDSIYNECIYHPDYDVVRKYVQFCHVLQEAVDVLACKICIDCGVKQQELVLHDMHYEFMGYEYGMISSQYSCLVHEKELIDTIEVINTNEYGLLSCFDDVMQFVELRKIAREQYDQTGFEFGEEGVDFVAMAIYRCVDIDEWK